MPAMNIFLYFIYFSIQSVHSRQTPLPSWSPSHCTDLYRTVTNRFLL